MLEGPQQGTTHKYLHDAVTKIPHATGAVSPPPLPPPADTGAAEDAAGNLPNTVPIPPVSVPAGAADPDTAAGDVPDTGVTDAARERGGATGAGAATGAVTDAAGESESGVQGQPTLTLIVEKCGRSLTLTRQAADLWRFG